MCIFNNVHVSKYIKYFCKKKNRIFSWFLDLMTTSFWLPSQSFVNSSMYQNNLRILFKLLILISYIPHIPSCLVLLKQPASKHWAGSLQQGNFSLCLDANLTKLSPLSFILTWSHVWVAWITLVTFFIFFPSLCHKTRNFWCYFSPSLGVKPSQHGWFAS